MLRASLVVIARSPSILRIILLKFKLITGIFFRGFLCKITYLRIKLREILGWKKSFRCFCDQNLFTYQREFFNILIRLNESKREKKHL